MQSRVQVHFADKLAIHRLADALYHYLAAASNRQISVVCIGTDRATGDALGPLVGRTLQSLRLPARVYGTIKEPIGANNLAELEQTLRRRNDFVIAIDASLGSLADVGRITTWPGSMRPGTGVGKSLPAIGQISILGCVNVGTIAPMQVLQCTRLDTVLEMTDVITFALGSALRRHFTQRAIEDAAVAAAVAQEPVA